MSHARPFFARLKPKNRDLIKTLKLEFGVRSEAAALNKLLDRIRAERQNKLSVVENSFDIQSRVP